MKKLTRKEITGFRIPTTVRVKNVSKGLKIVFGKYLRAGQEAVVVRRGSEWAQMYDLDDLEITLADRKELIATPNTRTIEIVKKNVIISDGKSEESKDKDTEETSEEKPDEESKDKTSEEKPDEESKDEASEEKPDEESKDEASDGPDETINESTGDGYPVKGSPAWAKLSVTEKGKITKARNAAAKEDAPKSIKR